MYKEKVDSIARDINSLDMIYVVGKREKHHIDEMLGMVSTDFGNLENGDEVVATGADVEVAHNSLNVCKRILLEVPITERVSTLVKDICLLLHNWNQNIAHNERIHKDCRFLTNAVDQHYTITGAIEVLKNILERASLNVRMDDNINSISRHYLTALDKIHEEKECGGSCADKECACS